MRISIGKEREHPEGRRDNGTEGKEVWSSHPKDSFNYQLYTCLLLRGLRRKEWDEHERTIRIHEQKRESERGKGNGRGY